MSKKKESKEVDFLKFVGGIIDAPLEDFINTIIDEKVPIGVLLNTKLYLTSAYDELVVRKNAIISRIIEGVMSQDDPNTKSTLEGLYAEMIKIEQKVLYLVERIRELQDVG